MNESKIVEPTDEPEKQRFDQDHEMIRHSKASIADAERHVADSVDRLNECRGLLDRTSRTTQPGMPDPHGDDAPA